MIVFRLLAMLSKLLTIYVSRSVQLFSCFTPQREAQDFMRRYWYLSPIKEISTDYSISESKVKMSLLRSRNELRQLLEKEGINL